jgi:hypothetical protein
VWYTSITKTSNYRYTVWFLLQTRFVLDNSSSDTLWYIPVSYTTQQEVKNVTKINRKTFPRIWLKQEPTITIRNLTQPKSFEEWVLFNIQATGKWSSKLFVWWQRIHIFRYKSLDPVLQSNVRISSSARGPCLSVRQYAVCLTYTKNICRNFQED